MEVKKEPGKDVLVVDKKARGSALQILAARMDLTPKMMEETLRNTAFSACKTDPQFWAAVVVANSHGLNPLLKEMTAFPGKNGGIIPVVMIDGWIKIVNRQPNFDGVELIENRNEKGENNASLTDVDSVTAKFYIKDRSHPVVVTEYMKECFDSSKEPWKKWPIRMLRHKAYIQGARVAFGIAGIYDDDEKDRIIDAEIAIVDPVIGLKGAPQKEAPAAQEEHPQEQIPPEDKDHPLGDLTRFGENTEKAKNLEPNFLKAMEDKNLGREKVMAIVGNAGFPTIADIDTFENLVKVVNAILAAMSGK